MAQGEITKFLEDAVQLVQQVSLAGEYSLTTERSEVVPQRAAPLECPELVAVLITGNQFVEGLEQRVLVVGTQAGAECGNRFAGLLSSRRCVKPVFSRQRGRQRLQAGVESLPGVGGPLAAACLVGEAAQTVLVDPAVVRADAVGQQRFQLLLERIGGLAAQQLCSVAFAPLVDARGDPRSAEQLLEVGHDPADQLQGPVVRAGRLVRRGRDVALRIGEQRLASPQPALVCLGQGQGLLAHRVVRAATDLVGDGAAAHLHLGQVDGVLPHFVDQLGPGDQPGNAAHQDAGRQAQTLGKRPVHEADQFVTDPGDLGHQILGAGDATVIGAAESRHQEPQQVNRFVAAAAGIQPFQDTGQVAQPRDLDRRHLLDFQMVDLVLQVDRPARFAGQFGDQRISDQRTLGQPRLSDYAGFLAPDGMDREAALRVVRHQQPAPGAEQAVIGNFEHRVAATQDGHGLEVAAQRLAVFLADAAI